MGGRGSAGRAGGGASVPTESSQQAVKTMLDSANLTIRLDVNKNPTYLRLLDSNYTGPVRLVEMLGTRTFKEFESYTGLSRSSLVSALQQIHQNKNVSVVRKVRKRDRYARGGGSPAKTIFEVEITN